MPEITLPDKSTRKFDKPLTVDDIAMDIGSGLAKATVAGKIDGRLVDASEIVSKDCKLEIVTIKDDEEALKIASNSKYGLHASVFTQDIDRAFHMAKSLPCGTVSVNTFSEGDIKTPFGGYKQSGSLSRDQGTEALNSFLQTKTIWISHQ